MRTQLIDPKPHPSRPQNMTAISLIVFSAMHPYFTHPETEYYSHTLKPRLESTLETLTKSSKRIQIFFKRPTPHHKEPPRTHKLRIQLAHPGNLHTDSSSQTCRDYFTPKQRTLLKTTRLQLTFSSCRTILSAKF
ncbi:hypothetical protein KC19_6G154700 [Ceratodon purpureus]|uniref:Uncharacterized protein n=1 Tax=Ceratodon purpureus TaxID=3225 RepID=A0A8T0HGX4_CERPU|nr:hypothetical protein KC19_6G154700 [Ceratodon purpureus]